MRQGRDSSPAYLANVSALRQGRIASSKNICVLIAVEAFIPAFSQTRLAALSLRLCAMAAPPDLASVKQSPG
jgi:hypothetical protein